MGAQKIPMYTLLVGAAVKAALNYFLIGTPRINIYGAPIASLACYTISAGINLAYTFKRTEVRVEWGSMLIRPALATLVMSIAVALSIRFIGSDSSVKTLLLVVLGVGAYIVAAPLTGAVRRADLAQFPALDRIAGKARLQRAAKARDD
jgi:stage V sporulation protein B